MNQNTLTPTTENETLLMQFVTIDNPTKPCRF